MKKLTGLLMLLWACTASGDEFFDDFSWSIINNDPDYYTFSNGILSLRANSGDLFEFRTDYKNLFLIDNPISGDFIATLSIKSFIPFEADYAQIDIVVFDDEDNHVRGEYGYWEGAKRLGAATEINQVYSPIPATLSFHGFGNDPFSLRLMKIGNMYTFYVSEDGINYLQQADSFAYGDGSPAKLGFIAMVDPSESSVAEIDSFEVTAVPEPSVIALFLMGCLFFSWRKNTKN